MREAAAKEFFAQWVKVGLAESSFVNEKAVMEWSERMNKAAVQGSKKL